MRPYVPVICLAAAVAISAQTAPKTSTASKAPAAAKAASATSGAASAAATYKVPADEKKIPGIPRTGFSLKYQDIKIGTGPAGEAGQLWKVNYKGWRAADGIVFDQSADHRQPILDKDGKPEMGPDGKPKLGDPQPMAFPQGQGRLIPGFDYGVSGMKVGGKRRIFIPWQIAYGTRNIPDRPDHPGIPEKSDLIFDVELVGVSEMPAPPQRPMPPGAPGSAQPQSGAPPRPGTPVAPGVPVTGRPVAPDANAKPAATPPPSQPAQPSPQPAQPTPPPSK